MILNLNVNELYLKDWGEKLYILVFNSFMIWYLFVVVLLVFYFDGIKKWWEYGSLKCLGKLRGKF